MRASPIVGGTGFHSYFLLSWEARMFRSSFGGAVWALLAAFLMAAIAKWAEFQPNRVEFARGAGSSQAKAASVSVQSVSVLSLAVHSLVQSIALHGVALNEAAPARSTISCRLVG